MSLLNRIIPVLLIHNGGLYKTRLFSAPKYVGDPINAVKIFNQKQVDELFLIDIDATVSSLEPNYSLIEKLASECRMPLCYGGGIKRVDQFERLIGLGVEKVSISSASIDDPSLISSASQLVGSQSVVVVVDVRPSRLFPKRYIISTHNNRIRCSIDLIQYLSSLQSSGVGEIVLNSVDRDGTKSGYDLDLLNLVYPLVTVPLTIMGGASSFHEIHSLSSKYSSLGFAAGSICVFHGKYNAVLIQYPLVEERLLRS